MLDMHQREQPTFIPLASHCPAWQLQNAAKESNKELDAE